MSNFFCASLHFSQFNLISYDLDAFGAIVFFMSPMAVVLSMITGVLGWGWPISSNAIHIGSALLQFMYDTATSVSHADDVRDFIASVSACTAPFF